jgi:hypothetical protein
MMKAVLFYLCFITRARPMTLRTIARAIMAGAPA